MRAWLSVLYTLCLIVTGGVILIVSIFFTGCQYDPEPLYPEMFDSFEEVSQPYLDQYGEPEHAAECFSYNSYHYVEWWWYSIDFMVRFKGLTYYNLATHSYEKQWHVCSDSWNGW